MFCTGLCTLQRGQDMFVKFSSVIYARKCTCNLFFFYTYLGYIHDMCTHVHVHTYDFNKVRLPMISHHAHC